MFWMIDCCKHKWFIQEQVVVSVHKESKVKVNMHCGVLSGHVKLHFAPRYPC